MQSYQSTIRCLQLQALITLASFGNPSLLELFEAWAKECIWQTQHAMQAGWRSISLPRHCSEALLTNFMPLKLPLVIKSLQMAHGHTRSIWTHALLLRRGFAWPSSLGSRSFLFKAGFVCMCMTRSPGDHLGGACCPRHIVRAACAPSKPAHTTKLLASSEHQKHVD